MTPEGCTCHIEVKRRWLNTRYANDEDNWVTSCRQCYEQLWEQYDELWNDNVEGGSPFSKEPPKDDEL